MSMSFLKKLFGRKETATLPQPTEDRTTNSESKSGTGPSLETQIAELEKVGLPLNDGICIDDFLLSFDRDEYENSPFELIFFIYGIEVEKEPWGRFFCPNVWNLDMECIDGTGSYAAVMSGIMRITQRPELLSDVTDDFDFDKPTAQLNYTLNGVKKSFTLKVEDDWADPQFINAFLDEVTEAVGDGRKFWAVDNGQSSILYFITQEQVDQLNVLSKGAFGRT